MKQTNSKMQYKRFIMLLGTILIIAVETAMFACLWYNYYANRELRHMRKYFRYFYYYRRGHWTVIVLYAVVLILFMKVLGGFRVGYLRNLDVFYSQILSVIATNAVEYLQLALIAKWKFLQFSTPIAVLAVLQMAVGILWIVAMRSVYARLYPPHEMLLIYGDISPKALIRKLESRGDKYLVKQTMHLKEGIDQILAKIPEYESIIIGDIPSHERNLFLKFCFEHNIRCYSVPKISDIMIISASEIDLFDSPLLLFRNNGLTFGQSFVKRAMDIAIGLTGCILASPVMLLIAAAIKLYDGGPVMYSQDRLTKDGRTFRIYKFRSMIVESEKKGARLASAHDDRITPVGKVIRRLHVDELPQLFNVLIGDMSFVGPRPEREEITSEYEQSIPQFRFRLKMKAGLTGYAQVYGQYNTVPYDKLKLDLTYIENYSFWLDIKLILLTVKILFQKEKSEGVADSQKTALKKEKI
ncbi:MAG: exopolysaccharide biosynthesis polyprenyl glycosylphosphotransferase [Eubacterium sp.]|nr:exopolysaccharide biosynthesis polyprenyl glycosylphosphotransferase [Eubacterium sp.]MCI8917187.1 exopolysaccharide biosynthesis polyprenyl glycosylphosphotransferase [Eubacterium sp.]